MTTSDRARRGEGKSAYAMIPEDVERDHLRAAKKHERTINWWNGSALMPGIVAVCISIVWGNGRSSEAGDPTLWDTNSYLALALLASGLVLIALATVAIVVAARAKARHTRLLEAHGVILNSTKTKERTR